MKSLFQKLNNALTAKKELALGAICFTMANPAHSAGLSKVNDIMTKVSDALQAAAIVTVTVAVFWAGYKIVFGGQTFREAAPILIGGVVIGSAAQIASLLVG